MAQQDAWRVCHPDIKNPFSSLEDACERLLPYHVIADYEAEEDDKLLDADTTGQMLSRSQQWDQNLAAKIAEFTSTFEKQVLAFNMITRKRALGEFRAEERLFVEQTLLREEKQAMFELRAEIESREKAGREAAEAKMRMALAQQAEQARAEAQAQAEMMARGPMRGNAAMGHIEGSADMMHGWGGGGGGGGGDVGAPDEEEPSEDFLNDENEPDNGEVGSRGEWRDAGELDLNTR
ncbi:hypothetical protein QJS10_CPA07g01165 [Acorus calamus]|uniref:GLTSCR protein conserved domain-containing protein n=1 Tax=Acorus calamus TaxID=4465 RepID=A0AAV9EGI8_ACOCL|nr:hypothetical protein QJS10_CPA07g01165 [Acorus calamus]